MFGQRVVDRINENKNYLPKNIHTMHIVNNYLVEGHKNYICHLLVQL